MATLVLHRLTEWPISGLLLPVLRALGVPEATLGCVHYYRLNGGKDPFERLPEGRGVPEATEPLLAASGAVAAYGRELASIGDDDEIEEGFHWTASEEELAQRARKAGYTVVLAREAAKQLGNRNGQTVTAGRAKKAPDAAILSQLLEAKDARETDASYDFAILSLVERIEAFARGDEATLRRLIEATYALEGDRDTLAGMMLERFFTAERLRRLELETLASLSVVEPKELAERAATVVRKRVLGQKSASVFELMQVFDMADSGHAALTVAEKARFDALWKAAIGRDDFTLEQWVYALNRSAIDQATFDGHVIEPFRRAVAAGFSDRKGYGDLGAFRASIAAVAAAEPDLALQALVPLSGHFNENGLRELAAHAKALPKKGYSKATLAAVGAHFSQPSQRAGAKIFGKLLSERGVELRAPKPPALKSIDVTHYVGTDVATLLVGSFDAVETVTAAEDPEEWPRLVRKTKSLGLAMQGDGTYGVRVIGAVSAARANAEVKAGATRLGIAPLEIDDDALTVSGLVGAGGTPTFPFPSGRYAAHLLVPTQPEIAVTIVIHPTAKLPAWPFGKKNELPILPL